MPAAISRRGDDRSWLVVLLVSLTTLAFAASGFSSPTEGSAQAASTETGLSVAPSPVRQVLPPPALVDEPESSPPPERKPVPVAPLWSGAAAGDGPAATTPVPRRLTIPRLDLKMAIVGSGVTEEGQMDLPDQPDRVGWYRYGPRPGDRSGSAVLAGHVDSAEFGIGPLAQLRQLQRGDRIVVQHSDGEQAYAVRRVQLVSKRTVPLDEVFDRTGPPRLRIVTCGGPYIPSRGGYLDNLVISADPL